MTKRLSEIFATRTADISSLFESYRVLHSLYAAVLKTGNVNQNSLKAFERAKESANVQQERISSGLYSQGFILLTGSAEVLLKNIFENLLFENFTKIKFGQSTNIAISDLQEILRQTARDDINLEKLSSKFGQLVVEEIFKSKNPSEKLNFQNAVSMKEIYFNYCGIVLADEENISMVHKYWQQRHGLIHNGGIIDQRYVHNVSLVGLLSDSEKVGSKIIINKQSYIECLERFRKLFDDIDDGISKAEMAHTLS